MATINMTDLDWLNVYSQFVGAAFESAPDAPGVVQPIISVTFDPSESFSAFTIGFPFTLPGSFQYGSWDFNDANLAISASSITPSPGELTISGSNLSASSLTVDFTLTLALGVVH